MAICRGPTTSANGLKIAVIPANISKKKQIACREKQRVNAMQNFRLKSLYLRLGRSLFPSQCNTCGDAQRCPKR